MNIADVCHHSLVTVRPLDAVAEAARRMRESHVGYVVVVEPESAGPTAHRIAGVLTDRDIVVAVVAQDANPRDVLVKDVMTRDPAVLKGLDSLDAAIRTMRQVGVRRMPVVDKLGEPIGVLSLDDVLDSLSDELAGLAGAIRNERRIESVVRV